MSRFVSGGTDAEPTQRDEAWLKAQQELDAAAIAKQEAARAGSGKSLYETLQANKAAKQEAFEESTKLTNQFRSLDEDEIEFLDSVQERARAKELAEKKHTKEHLEEFRKQQEEAERVAKELDAAAAVPPTVSETWAVAPRKRKKGKEKDGIGGLKIRRTSTGEKAKDIGDAKTNDQAAVPSRVTPVVADKSTEKSSEKVADKPAASESPSPPATAAGLGLGAYSSDED